MAIQKLEVKKRDFSAKKNDAIRLANYIPAVVYGPDQEAMSIMVEDRLFEKVYEASGASTVIQLVFSDGNTMEVLIQDIQRDAVKDHIIHIDFYKLQAGHKLTTEIALNFINEISAKAGNLYIEKEFVSVKCLPKDLVDHIDVDLSLLTDENSALTVDNLNIPETMEVLDEGHLTIAHVVLPRTKDEEDETTESTESPAETTETSDDDDKKEE